MTENPVKMDDLRVPMGKEPDGDGSKLKMQCEQRGTDWVLIHGR